MADTKPQVLVHGLAELNLAFKFTEKNARKEVNTALRDVADPIQRDAEALTQTFRNIGNRWGRMRIGVTRNLVYVAPKERGRGSRTNLAIRRPLFGTKLMDEAMDPALQRNVHNIESHVGRALDRLADGFYRV